MEAAVQTKDAAGDVAQALAADMKRLAAETDAGAVTLRLADSLACALGAEAIAEKDGGIVRIAGEAKFAPGSGATVWWSQTSAPTEAAALRNAVAVRFLDYNDTYVAKAIVHPSDMIAALVALAEERGKPWERLIEAVSVAYEAMCRFADVVNLRKHGFDGSTLSPLGVAAGGAWLLGLSESASAEALRLAALDAGMLRVVRQGRLSDWKTVSSGLGAMKGLFAVRMAEAGAKAPPGAFDGPESFSERIGGAFDYAGGGDARLGRTILKAFPAQIFIQGMIELAGQLRERLGSRVDAVERIEVRTFRQAVDMVGGHHAPGEPLNRESADHSSPFAIAAVLVTGSLRAAEYDALLKSERVASLMERIAVGEAAEASSAFPAEFQIAMTAFLGDGSQESVRHARPTPLTPAILQAKFDQLWPRDVARGWRWKLDGEEPRFPVTMD